MARDQWDEADCEPVVAFENGGTAMAAAVVAVVDLVHERGKARGWFFSADEATGTTNNNAAIDHGKKFEC